MAGYYSTLALGIRNGVKYGLWLRMGIRLCRAGPGNRRTTLHSQIPKRTDKGKPAIKRKVAEKAALRPKRLKVADMERVSNA